MKVFFDEQTDNKLLNAKTKEEVAAIIAATPEADKLADKIDLVMNEISVIRGNVEEELSLDQLDNAAGGSKLKRVDLSPSQGCIATANLSDMMAQYYCWSNDFCMASNDYDYHFTRWTNCPSGGHHDWSSQTCQETLYDDHGVPCGTRPDSGYRCSKCNECVDSFNISRLNFDD